FAHVNPYDNRITTLWTGEVAIASGFGAFYPAFASDGKSCALIMQSFKQPPEVWAGQIGNWAQVTHVNASSHPSSGDARKLHWTGERCPIQGWLLYPKTSDPARRYPRVVPVPGGPASAARPSWPGSFFSLPLLSSQGYFVLFPNPRGSYGQGEDFTRGNVKD